MTEPQKHPTHRDLMPADMCPALMFKHILTHALDDEVSDDRPHPGDGYFWCEASHKEVGPDDELCDPERCRPGRDCYEGISL